VPSGVIVDPRMLSRLANFFPSLCTIQEATYTVDTHGYPEPTWEDKEGHIDLACAIAPMYQGAPERAEITRADGTIVVATHHISLAGYYPDIRPEMQVVIDRDFGDGGFGEGEIWDIVSVETSSHQELTRLRVRKVE